MRYVSATMLLVLTVAALIGCPAEIWLTTRLHVLQAQQGTFSETGDPGIYALDLNGANDTVIWFTDRPLHVAGEQSLDEFVGETWPRVLEGQGPTGAVAYQDDAGYWSMAPAKAVGIAADKAGNLSWQMQMKGVPDLGTFRDVHVYLDDDGAGEVAENDAYVFLHGAAEIAFEPCKDAHDFRLRLRYPHPVVTAVEVGAGFDTYVETLDAFIENAWAGDFVENPPNAAIQIEAPDGSTRVIVAILSNPQYDALADEMTYRAQILSGDPDVLPGPGLLFIDSWDDPDDSGYYTVVVNHEEQYSIWFADREIPLGWREVGVRGTKQECLDYIKEVWTDMRPLSLAGDMERVVLFDILARELRSVWVLHTRGSLVEGRPCAELRNAVQDALDNGRRRIVIDLSRIGAIDSAGVAELASAYTKAALVEGRLALVFRRESVDIDIEQLGYLLTFFEIYPTVDAAVNALAP